jgi:pimeloyl-ACP methyl ester carboxylesterase
MSVIVINNQVVHYEVFGRGKPVLFLHGWLGSWRYWYPTIEFVGEHFRTYSFDFFGFGDSRRNTTIESIQNYSEQVIHFLNEMGIDRVSLVGHSMGGMVGLNTAINHPERIDRVATVGAPIQGTSLSWLLKLTDISFFAHVLARWPWLRGNLFRFFLTEGEETEVHEIIVDSLKSSANTLRSAVHSMMRTDLRPQLPRLRVPALIVHGQRDDIVDPRQATLFTPIQGASVVIMKNSRHFPFLDEPAYFNETLMRFLNHHDPSDDAPTAPSSLRQTEAIEFNNFSPAQEPSNGTESCN